jgi:hypothetical protein
MNDFRKYADGHRPELWSTIVRSGCKITYLIMLKVKELDECKHLDCRLL